MIPTIVKIRHIHIYSGDKARILSVADRVLICTDNEHLKKTFKEQAKLEGIEVTEDDVDNGYVKTEDGSICISWAKKAQ